jgi:hypothetical protein
MLSTLLLLLHLLQIHGGDGDLGRLLGALDEHAPVLRYGQLAVESRWLVAGLYVNGYV